MHGTLDPSPRGSRQIESFEPLCPNCLADPSRHDQTEASPLCNMSDSQRLNRVADGAAHARYVCSVTLVSVIGNAPVPLALDNLDADLHINTLTIASPIHA